MEVAYTSCRRYSGVGTGVALVAAVIESGQAADRVRDGEFKK